MLLLLDAAIKCLWHSLLHIAIGFNHKSLGGKKIAPLLLNKLQQQTTTTTTTMVPE
jgi:hypothetical protein